MVVITESFITDPWCVLQFTLAMRERLTLPVSGIIGETETIFHVRLKAVKAVMESMP